VDNSYELRTQVTNSNLHFINQKYMVCVHSYLIHLLLKMPFQNLVAINAVYTLENGHTNLNDFQLQRYSSAYQ